jgi:hypothetical protein
MTTSSSHKHVTPPPFGAKSWQLMQEFGSHSFTIDDESCYRMSSRCLVIASQELLDAFG